MKNVNVKKETLIIGKIVVIKLSRIEKLKFKQPMVCN